MVVFCKQKTAYYMRISYWSSDVCSSDLNADIGDRHRSRVDEAQPHPLAGAEQPGPVFLRSVTIDQIGVGGRRHVSDVSGVHPHLPPHGAVGGGHAFLGTATQHTEDCLLLAIEIPAFYLELGDEWVGREVGPNTENDSILQV